MKKYNLFGFVAILSALIMLSGCGDDGPGSASKDETLAAFDDLNVNLTEELGSFQESEGALAFGRLSELTSGSNILPSLGLRTQNTKSIKETRAYIKEQMDNISILVRNTTLSNARTSSSEPFDYNESKGVYTYNPEIGDFERTDDSNIIEILFPTEGSETNNAKFQLNAYQEIEAPVGYYNPTVVKATLFVDDVKEFELDLSMNYNNLGDPVKGNVLYFVNPFLLTVTFDDSKTTSSSFTQTLTKNGTTLIGFGASVSYANAEKLEDDITSASIYIQLLNVRFVLNANINQQTEPTIVVLVDGKNAGFIYIEFDETTGSETPYIQFNDGSSEPLENVLGDLIGTLESLVGTV